MKILFLSHQFYPFVGGIEVNSEVLATQFVEAGHEVRMMTWTKENGNREFPFSIIRNPSRLQLILEHKVADVVFENNLCLQLSWPLVFTKKPHIIAVRTWIARMNGKLSWQDRLKLRWLRSASAVIAISEAIRKKSYLPATVIGNPYRSDLFRIKPEIKKNADFVFLGRLVSDKGADIAIEAFGRMINSSAFTNYTGTLTIIGDGPEMQRLTELCHQNSIADRVIFTNALRGENLVNELNGHLFFLIPSRWEEPFGNVALEGMACGCIAIASRGGGLTDAVGSAGLLFERGNADDLSNQMASVINDVSLQQSLLHNAVIHLQKHLPNVVAHQYLEVIEAAAKKNKEKS